MKQMLDQLLGAGKGWLNEGGDSRKAQMKGVAQGGLAAGAMALLLGNKKIRKYGGKVAAVGGAAALGGLAYKLYQDCRPSSRARRNRPSPSILCRAMRWMPVQPCWSAPWWRPPGPTVISTVPSARRSSST